MPRVFSAIFAFDHIQIVEIRVKGLVIPFYRMISKRGEHISPAY